MRLSRRSAFLFAECLAIFIGLPLLILFFKDRSLMMILLWIGSALVALHLLFQGKLLWKPAAFKAGMGRMLRRFLILAPVIALLTWIFMPDSMFSFPRERPRQWLIVMLLYPLLSVWPQEVIYRSFLYHRYKSIFGTGAGYVAASALLFGFMHIIFLNPVAVIMTMAGGYLFASDYARHQSLTLACIEHALYGCLVFTLGLGIYFYSHASWGMP